MAWKKKLCFKTEYQYLFLACFPAERWGAEKSERIIPAPFVIQIDRIVHVSESCHSPLLSFCPFLSTKTYWRLIWLKSVTWPNFRLSCWWGCQVTQRILYVEDLCAPSQELHCTAVARTQPWGGRSGEQGQPHSHERTFVTSFFSMIYTQKKAFVGFTGQACVGFWGCLEAVANTKS